MALLVTHQNFGSLGFRIWNLPALLNKYFGLYGIFNECELNNQLFQTISKILTG